MRSIRLSLSAVPLALVLVAASGAADHWCGDPPDVDVAGQAYVFIDCTAATGDCHGYPYSVWIYLESNGEPGAQRGGTGWDSDVCQNSASPDTGIW